MGIYGASYAARAAFNKQLGYHPAGTNGLDDTGNGAEQEETLYGVIDAGALTTAQAGTYSDDITLKLEY